MESTINERIREIIKYCGLSASMFAKEINIPQTTISNILTKNTEPGYKILSAISNHFKLISPDWLLNGDGEMIKTNNQPEYMNQSVESDARKFDVMEDRESTLKQMIAFMERQMNAQREMMDKHLSEQREKAERDMAKENEKHVIMLKNQEEMLNQKTIELENKNMLIQSLQENIKFISNQLSDIQAKHEESIRLREEQSRKMEEMAAKMVEIESQNKKIIRIGQAGEERKAN